MQIYVKYGKRQNVRIFLVIRYDKSGRIAIFANETQPPFPWGELKIKSLKSKLAIGELKFKN